MNLKLEYDSFQDFADRLWPSLSEEGMWVPSDHPASVGELVDFEVTLADGFRLFHGTGQVIGVGPGPESGSERQGLTVRFGELDQPSRNLVRKVVSKHIGEGGKLFVLSSPATKVGVLGGDEDGEPADQDVDGVPAMGPEDLVAPFPEFESGGAWDDDNEPELTSFLRPGNGPTEFEDEDTGDTEPEPIVPEPSAPEPSAPDPPEPGESEPVGLTQSELSEQFERSLAESESIEATIASALDPEPVVLDEMPPEVEPLPSTVIPPAADSLELGVEPADDMEVEQVSAEEDVDEPSRRSWWLYAVVALVAVGAALIVATRMDTPLSRWFGGSSPGQPADGGPATVSEQAAGSEPAPVAPARVTDEEARSDAADAAGDVEAGDLVDTAAGSEMGSETDSPPAGAEETAVEPVVETEAPASSAEPVADTTGAGVASIDPVRLTRVTWRDVEGDTVVRLWLDGAASSEGIETEKLTTGAPRIVLKLAGIEGSTPTDPIQIGSAHVDQLRFGIHVESGARRLHVVSDLTDAEVDLVGSVTVDEDGLELRFSRP